MKATVSKLAVFLHERFFMRVFSFGEHELVAGGGEAHRRRVCG
jgi:hypothetical protein